MRSDAEPLDCPGADRGAVEVGGSLDGGHGGVDVLDEEAGVPSSISSAIDPRSKAITGVPHAIASATL